MLIGSQKFLFLTDKKETFYTEAEKNQEEIAVIRRVNILRINFW